ncbi:Outer spore wall protein RRT8 [Pleurostoma richardsiae]|uniref:Outer spore wall protein RRT8 n=1 Tax=Pleurostoma richardsiae TaxID=41990 RepID=A0AA38VYP4_9PEZI|nr:Outer spore wall protein RRT8 [Pleurostoma richardsiae]
MSQRPGFVESVQSKAQEVAKEDFDKARTLFSHAARSGSYLYPVRGIVYFVTHRALWKPLLSRIVPTLTLSVSVITGMFLFTYIPQLSVLVFVNGPLAVFTTVLLILSESSTIISLLSRNWLLQDALLDTFDGTLVARNATEVVKQGRELKAGGDPISKLGRIIKSPFSRFSPKAIIRYVMYLPLNFIPVVGTVIFILLQGRSRGRVVHDRYFQLKQWSSSQKSSWLQEHTGPYTAFGTVATLLELIPVASIFFSFTNTVGAALWAADIEGKNTEMTQGTAPNLRETAKKAE